MTYITEHFEETVRLSGDLLAAARTMRDDEARFLVYAYYLLQDARIRAANQERGLGTEPHVLITWLKEKNSTLEEQIKAALDQYTNAHPMGAWMRSIHGIGPVLSAGLLAHIYMGWWCKHCHARDQERCAARQQHPRPKLRTAPHNWEPVHSCQTAGQIWAFAGLAGDGQRPWVKGKRRPFNADFKTLCWKIGDQFVKNSSRPRCWYGRVYKERKLEEIRNNEAGRLADQAAKKLPRFDPKTEAYKWYAKGMLPPGHIDARAQRYAVKLFLSHLHAVWYEQHWSQPTPAPFPPARPVALAISAVEAS